MTFFAATPTILCKVCDCGGVTFPVHTLWFCLSRIFSEQTLITNSQSGNESEPDGVYKCELFTLSLYTVLTRLECVRRWRSGVEEEWMVE